MAQLERHDWGAGSGGDGNGKNRGGGAAASVQAAMTHEANATSAAIEAAQLELKALLAAETEQRIALEHKLADAEAALDGERRRQLQWPLLSVLARSRLRRRHLPRRSRSCRRPMPCMRSSPRS